MRYVLFLVDLEKLFEVVEEYGGYGQVRLFFLLLLFLFESSFKTDLDRVFNTLKAEIVLGRKSCENCEICNLSNL